MNKTATAQHTQSTDYFSQAKGLGMLQRRCACGSHTPASGECPSCATKKKIGMQRKLKIGASNDPLEREADRVAEQVMAMPLNSGINASPPRIQRFSGQASDGLTTAPTSVDRVLASSGRPLEPALRQDMESRFGYDFSQVRIHTGAAAEQSVRDVNAQAYTVGSNVVFGEGRFKHNSYDGQQLLAHELTHVIQQRSGLSRLQRVITRGAGGCAFSVTEVDEDDNGPKAAGRRAHDQIQTFLLPILNEVPIPRATKRRIDSTGCQDEGVSEGYADLMRRSGILYSIGEIKPIGSASLRGVLESEHYIRRADQSADRLFGTGICGAAGDDDRMFQRDVFRGPLRPTFAKLDGVLPHTTVIGDFVGDRSRTLKAKMVSPGAVGYWCTGGRSDTYTCGTSPEEMTAYIDRVVGGPAQEVLDRFIRESIQQPLERELRRQNLGDLIRLAERHFGSQIRQLLRSYLGPVADQVLNGATADQIAELVEQAVGAEARTIVTTLVRLVTDALISELRTQLRNVLTELVRDALVALCVGVPAVSLSDLLDKLRQQLRERTLQLVPVVVSVVAARFVAAVLAEINSMLIRMAAAISEALGVIGEALLFIGDILLRALAAILIALLAIVAVILSVAGLIALFDPVPGDEAALAAAALVLAGLIPALGRFVVTGSTEETEGGA